MNARLVMLEYVFLACVLMVSGVSAQSLKERQDQKSEDQKLAEEVAYTNQVCRSNIQARVDWQSFSAPEYSASAQPVASCDAALSAIESFCTDQPGQEAVRRAVNHVVCVKGSSRDVHLKEGTLFFQVESAPSDNFVFVRDYLMGEMTGDDGAD